MILTVPVFLGVTFPAELTEAILAFDDFQVTLPLGFTDASRVNGLLKYAVALDLSDNVGDLTVTAQEAETPFAFAVMVAFPAFLGMILPLEVTSAIFGAEDSQEAGLSGAVLTCNCSVSQV